jgi:hypothetical protein
MRRQIVAAALAAVSVLGMAAPALAQGQSCFFINQWRGWKAADDHTVYISVDPHRTYRLDMTGSCPELLFSDIALVTRNHASSICTALDWDLQITQRHVGFTSACIVGKMTLLTHDQVAALPDKLRP